MFLLVVALFSDPSPHSIQLVALHPVDTPTVSGATRYQLASKLLRRGGTVDGPVTEDCRWTSLGYLGDLYANETQCLPTS